MRILAVLISLMGLPSLASAAINWTLTTSKISYEVDHPMHNTTGVSKAAKGKGECDKTNCKFLIAAPVKTFDSGNGNRDAHAMEVIHGATHPMVIVRTEIPAADLKNGKTKRPMTVELNGVSHELPGQLDIEMKPDGSADVKGQIVAHFSDFKMERPALLAVPVKDEFVVTFESHWTSAK